MLLGSRAPRALLASLLVLAFAAGSSAQACETWAGGPPQCAPYLSGVRVYLYNGAPQSQTADVIRNLVGNISLIPIAACLNASLPFACKSAFPRCLNTTDSLGEVEAWEPQCRATCTEVNTACDLVYRIANQSPLNCTGSNTFVPSVEFYPSGNLSLPSPSGSGDVLQVPCDGAASVAPFECPMTTFGYRLVPIPEDQRASFFIPGLPCWRCPAPIISDKNFHISWYGTTVIGAISMVLTVLVAVPILADRKRRAFPTVLPAYLALSAHCIGWAYFMAGVVGHRNTFCEHDWLSADHSKVGCAIQAVVIVVASLCSVTWTTAIIFNVWWAIVLEKQVPPSWHLYQSLLCWGYPTLNGILMLAMKQTYFNETNSCFISDWWPPGTSSRTALFRPWITMSLWYFPITIFMFGNLAFIVQIIYKCFKTAKDWAMAKRLLMLQWRTFAYFVFFFYTTGYVVFLWVHVETRRNRSTEQLQKYITCLFAPPTGDSRNCSPDLGLPLVAGITLGWTDAIIGLWVFIVFGLGRENIVWWKQLAHNIRNGHFTITTFSRSTSNEQPTSRSMYAPSGTTSDVGQISRL